MSTLTDRDDFENAYFHFIEAARVLAAPPEEACERLGYFNVAYEAKLDFENFAELFNLPACTLTIAHKGRVDKIILELNKIPDEVISYTAFKDESLERMSHPCWQKLREMAATLVSELQPFTEVNCWYMEQDRTNWNDTENEI